VPEAEGQPLDAGEIVARFAYDSADRKGANVRPGTFLPMFEPDYARLETSVCRTRDCPDDRQWQLALLRGKPARCKADVPVAVILEQGLQCVAAPVANYDEHAVLLGWPQEKEDQKVIAIALVKASSRVLAPE
jgi:hypothetical protein